MKAMWQTTLMIVLASLLAGCPQTRKGQGLTNILKQYEVAIRWGQWDAAVAFISPEYRLEHPISRLEMDRLRLFHVTSYEARSAVPVDNGNGFLQEVEIHMFNKNQARERAIIDTQYWKYDEARKAWLLHSGLPDPTQKNY